ncbi:YeaH [Klebsiella variicola]|uniref:YeaH n=1 Tax=Klebsiella variicola TaxID=244366 RepID=A0A7H4MI14_KLEVA|nr:YeaH [Klebsiella variicola]
MTWFIDRRLNGKNKSAVNRQRFLRRYKAQIKTVDFRGYQQALGHRY